VLIVGNGYGAVEYARQINDNLHFGYRIIGCVSNAEKPRLKKLGTYEDNSIERYLKHEKEIKEVLNEAPLYEDIISILDGIGLDINEFTKTYSDKKIKDAVRYAKDLKDRYTVLWMYYDMFGLEEWNK
jgi:hypothetical protein